MLLCKQFGQDERHYLKQPHSTASVRHHGRWAADTMTTREGGGQQRGEVGSIGRFGVKKRNIKTQRSDRQTERETFRNRKHYK